MVFESIVVELINRYLGQFVENLDTSQLKIGIWGGDVVLNTLNIKESALDDLDLPVKVKAGHIGKLTLKIPWKNLYTEPVVAEIDGIYALAVPNIAIRYDAAKDKKAAQEEKQAKLKKIEENKKLQAEKDKPKDPKQDSFVEKLATQVIKNLQIRVSNIHVRYEDKYTNPLRPVSIGVVLQQLLFQTTDENWKEKVIKEAVTQIYKLIRLDSLAVYWNSKSGMFQDQKSDKILSEMKATLEEIKLEDGVHSPKKSKLNFIIRPISAVAHLRLHTKPQINQFTIPKVFLTLVFDEIAIALSKDQYDDVLEVLEAMDRMALMSKYKKTRPSVPYKGHAAQWWKHAYSAILEHTVQRRRRMWDWANIIRHRQRVRQYMELYIKVLEGKKLSTTDNALLSDCETELDIFNIVMARNFAEVKAQKAEAKRQEKKSGGWMGWFGGGKKKEDSSSKTASQESLGNKFEEEFNAGEKAKLYSAIGYDENAPDPTLPTEFVAVRLVTKWNKLSVSLIESEHQLLKLSLSDICASFGQRPAANAIRLDMKIDRLRVSGTPRKDCLPKLVNSIPPKQQEENSALLTVAFETNPLDGLSDSRVRVSSNALEVIYDAITINGLVEFFKPPESVRLKNFSEAAMAKYTVIKSQTATGMIYAMEERKHADIEVHLKPSYIIIPEGGELKKDVNMLLLNLGAFNINSEKNKLDGQDIDRSNLAKIEDLAYDKFHISLENVQMLFVQPGDTWQDSHRSAQSPLYILRPLSIDLTLEKCQFANDPNLPKLKVGGELKLVSIAVSDSKLLKLMKLAASIPLPKSAPPDPEELIMEQKNPLESADIRLEADINKAAMRATQINQEIKSEYVNFTDVSLNFLIKEVSVEVMETKELHETPFLKLTLTRIGAGLKMRTFDMALDAYLGGIYLQHQQLRVSPGIQTQLAKFNVVTGELINIINTPLESEDEPLLSFNYLQADRKGPEFKTTYKSTAQSMTIQFSTLDLMLQQGVLISLLEFGKKLEPPQAAEVESKEVAPSSSRRRMSSIPDATALSNKAAGSDDAVSTASSEVNEVMKMRVRAFVDNIQLGLCTEKALIMQSKVEGIEVGATMHRHKFGVSALMRKIELHDPDPYTKHPEILSVTGSEVLSFSMTMYENGTLGHKYDNVNNVDMDVTLKMGRAKFVFVNKFFTTLIRFVDNFAMAKAKLDEAALALQEAGKDVAKNLKEKEPRIQLSINVKAPHVILPQNSKSLDVLMVDLGDISISNVFSHIQSKEPTKATPGMALVQEKMTVMLTNLCLSRGILSSADTKNVLSQIDILEPMTFKIDLIRNCSRNWYHGTPDLQVKAVLDSVKVRISQEDLTMALHFLEENLTEKAADLEPPQQPLVVAKENIPQIKVTEEKTDVEGRTSKVQLESVVEEIYTMLKVDFKMVSIKLELFRGSSNLSQGNKTHISEKMMARLALSDMGVAFNMESDSSMDAFIYLEDFTLDDCRYEKRKGITQLIHRSKTSVPDPEGTSMVVDLKFKQNADEDKSIVLSLCSLRICLVVEFLMRMAEFFTSAMPKKTAKPLQEPVPSDLAVKQAKQIQQQTSQPPPKGSLDIVLKLQKPEIYLVEDQMNLQTNSLIVDVGVHFRMRLTPECLVLNGAISELSLVSCVFGNPESRLHIFRKARMISKVEKKMLETVYKFYKVKWTSLPYLYYVLSPCNITLIGNSPHSRDHHIDVTMTDFIISISPSTIRLLTAVMSGLSVQPEEQVVETKLKDYSNIWVVKKLEECSFWFTNSVPEQGSPVDQPLHAITDEEIEPTSRGELADEKLMISAPTLVIKMEGGVGHRTVPLLIVEAAFSGQVKNWSSQLYVESTLAVEVAYYNERKGVWEPILEPVVDVAKQDTRKWEICTEVVKGEIGGDEGDDAPVLLPPKMTINVVATDPLQLVLTKTCLEVLGNLGKSFNEAYQLMDFEGTMGAKIVPYVFRNQTGEELGLTLEDTFQPANNVSRREGDGFPDGAELSMDMEVKKGILKHVSLIKSTQEKGEKKCYFKLIGDALTYDVSMKEAKKRVYTSKKTAPNGDQYKIVSEVEALLGQTITSFYSTVQIRSKLAIPVEVFYHDSQGVKSCGTVLPDDVFHVPLKAVYCSTSELFFKPASQELNVSMSKECIKWSELNPESAKIKEMACEPQVAGNQTYYFNVEPSFENVFAGNSEEQTEQVITLTLHQTVILHNLLPFPVQYLLATVNSTEEGMAAPVNLEPGQYTPLDNASVNHSTLELLIPNYQGLEWSGKKMIKLDVPELSVWKFTANDADASFMMELGLHSKMQMGSFDLSVYSPYWIINMSEQTLALKEDEKDTPVVAEPDAKSIMLYFFKDKPIFGGTKRKDSPGKKEKEKSKDKEAKADKFKEVKAPGKVHLKIADGEWSDKFSLDTVGSSGNVSCKNKQIGNTFEVGVKIHLSASGLTKIVTFTPFYMLLNASTVGICIQEETGNKWVCVPPGACQAYYPKTPLGKDKEIKVKAKIEDSDKSTALFFLNKAHTTLLKLEDSFYGGINADCQVRESAMITTFKLYLPGMATVQFVNHTTQSTVSVKQSGTPWEALSLEPLTSQLYTWDSPTSKREIVWSCGKKKDAKSLLDQDNIEEFFADDDVKVYFVSFLDGMQRIVMFTEDLALATVAQEAGELEQADQEINLRLPDMGFSLVNNHIQQEVAYMGITSSGVIWEEKKKRFKAMKIKDSIILETAYQRYQIEVVAGRKKSSVMTLENKMEVDFEEMLMLKPRKCAIRRSFEDGIWVQYKTSPHSNQLHAKINRLQFDNQLRHAVFSTVLSPLPPPKSVAADSVPKPFVEVSLMMRIHEHSGLMQIKYFKVLVQEMNLKVDQGFLNATLALFASGTTLSRDQEAIDFEQDLSYSKRDLKEEAGLSIQAQKVSFYDYFHVSPIKVHLSFSLQGGEMSSGPTALQANVLNVFLQSVGVVLTDIQDVVFKLGYFERNNAFYNPSQLTSEFVRHYSGQAVKQMYVLVLGLDVLGNPFGLLRGLSEGIEDLFYEPYQGAIQGPEEFAEGLALGVRSLFGHAVGGAAGAVSRITGTLGKGLAALTLDDDYQKKRREQLNKRPATAREGFARGGKGLVMGVFDGVTGIVRKPVEGAKQEGVAGFFKGVGKGLVGVVTRPTSGVVDFASSSLEGIKRITDMTEEIRRLRPPRRIYKDGIIRPYIGEEAEGYQLLVETEKGKYVETDEYVAHAKVKEDGKIVFIITDQRVMLAKRGEIFGAWDTEWVITYQEMKSAPRPTAKGLEIFLKEKEKKKLFGSNAVKKEVPLANPIMAQSLVDKITKILDRLSSQV